MELMLPMEPVLDSLAKGLSIRYASYQLINPITMKIHHFPKYKYVSDEVMDTFKNEIKSHLKELSKQRHTATSVCYSYYLGKVRGNSLGLHGFPVESFSHEMSEVISKLPKLEDGESYGFPYPTSVWFYLNSDRKYEVSELSPWILELISDN